MHHPIRNTSHPTILGENDNTETPNWITNCYEDKPAFLFLFTVCAIIVDIITLYFGKKNLKFQLWNNVLVFALTGLRYGSMCVETYQIWSKSDIIAQWGLCEMRLELFQQLLSGSYQLFTLASRICVIENILQEVRHEMPLNHSTVSVSHIVFYSAIGLCLMGVPIIVIRFIIFSFVGLFVSWPHIYMLVVLYLLFKFLGWLSQFADPETINGTNLFTFPSSGYFSVSDVKYSEWGLLILNINAAVLLYMINAGLIFFYRGGSPQYLQSLCLNCGSRPTLTEYYNSDIKNLYDFIQKYNKF